MKFVFFMPVSKDWKKNLCLTYTFTMDVILKIKIKPIHMRQSSGKY